MPSLHLFYISNVPIFFIAIYCRTAQYSDLKDAFYNMYEDKPLSKNTNHGHRVSSGLAASNDTMKQNIVDRQVYMW